jgi:hypothetical protein
LLDRQADAYAQGKKVLDNRLPSQASGLGNGGTIGCVFIFPDTEQMVALSKRLLAE